MSARKLKYCIQTGSNMSNLNIMHLMHDIQNYDLNKCIPSHHYQKKNYGYLDEILYTVSAVFAPQQNTQINTGLQNAQFDCSMPYLRGTVNTPM